MKSANRFLAVVVGSSGLILVLLLAACNQEGAKGKSGGPQLNARQIKALEEVAEAGDAADKYSLAKKFRDGDTVPLSLTNAANWYRKSAESGYAKAQYHMGIACQMGEGVAKDPAEAAKWFLKASDQGYAKAQEKLGYLCWKGEGLAKNLVDAYKWHTLAAAGGEGKAAKALKKLELAMTPQQVADAKKAAAAFMPKKVYKNKKTDKEGKPE
jgi:TPR repeat protein